MVPGHSLSCPIQGFQMPVGVVILENTLSSKGLAKGVRLLLDFHRITQDCYCSSRLQRRSA